MLRNLFIDISMIDFINGDPLRILKEILEHSLVDQIIQDIELNCTIVFICLILSGHKCRLSAICCFAKDHRVWM